LSFLARRGVLRKVKISTSAARPSCTAVVRGGPLASQRATGCAWPLRLVATWTQPSCASRMSMSLRENMAPLRIFT